MTYEPGQFVLVKDWTGTYFTGIVIESDAKTVTVRAKIGWAKVETFPRERIS